MPTLLLDPVHVTFGKHHRLGILIRRNKFHKGSIRCHKRLLQILQQLSGIGITALLALLGTFLDNLFQA